MENIELAHHAKNIRIKILKMIHQVQSGHPGGALSATDLITTLYFNHMDINEHNVASIDRDRFVLSKGHASALMYAVLDEKHLLNEELSSFRRIESKLQGHPNMNYVAGVDMSTGSLGQGISCAVGMAIANKLSNNQHRIYVLVGDGECEEGQVWEALMAAKHYKLDNLCIMVDYNHLQIDGFIEDVLGMDNFEKKFEAFGCHVLSIDGHNYDEINKAFEMAKKIKGQPTLILANSIKGKGVSFMENDASWHGSAPNDIQLEQAINELEVI